MQTPTPLVEDGRAGLRFLVLGDESHKLGRDARTDHLTASVQEEPAPWPRGPSSWVSQLPARPGSSARPVQCSAVVGLGSRLLVGCQRGLLSAPRGLCPSYHTSACRPSQLGNLFPQGQGGGSPTASA